MVLSRCDFLEASAAGAVALASARDAGPLPRTQLREPRAAVRGPVRAPGILATTPRGWCSTAASTDPSAGGSARARHAPTSRRSCAGPAATTCRCRALRRQRLHGARRAATPSCSTSAASTASGSTARWRPSAPGLRNFELYRRLARRGLAVPSGSCPNVALGGLATRRRHGAGGSRARPDAGPRHRIRRRDRGRRAAARRARTTTCSGRCAGVAAASPSSRPCGCARAGCGGPRGSSPRIPASARDEVLAVWDELAPGAPGALTSICTLTDMRASAFGQYLGSEAALRRLVAPLARIGGVRFSAGTSEFLALQRRWAGCAEGGCGAVPRRELRRVLRVRRAQAPGARPARLHRRGRRGRHAGARRLRRRDQPRAGRRDRVRAPRRALQRADPLLQPARHRAAQAYGGRGR